MIFKKLCKRPERLENHLTLFIINIYKKIGIFSFKINNLNNLELIVSSFLVCYLEGLVGKTRFSRRRTHRSYEF